MLEGDSRNGYSLKMAARRIESEQDYGEGGDSGEEGDVREELMGGWERVCW